MQGRSIYQLPARRVADGFEELSNSSIQKLQLTELGGHTPILIWLNVLGLLLFHRAIIVDKHKRALILGIDIALSTLVSRTQVALCDVENAGQRNCTWTDLILMDRSRATLFCSVILAGLYHDVPVSVQFALLMLGARTAMASSFYAATPISSYPSADCTACGKCHPEFSQA